MAQQKAARCPVQKRARRADGDRTRSTITKAAVALIAEEGVAGTTQRKVAKRAGVSLASVTYHFATRDDLFEGAFDHMIDESVTQLRELKKAAQEGNISLSEAWDAVVRDTDGRTPAHVAASFELLVASMRQPHLRPISIRLLDALNAFFQTWTQGPDPARSALSLMLGLSLTEAASGRPLANGDLARIFIAFGLQPDHRACAPDHANTLPTSTKGS